MPFSKYSLAQDQEVNVAKLLFLESQPLGLLYHLFPTYGQ